MQKELSPFNKGFQLLEAVIAASVFLVVATALFAAYGYGSESATTAGMRTRATFVAEEGLEAARNIRDQNFTNLTNGTFGVGITSNQYVLTGSSDVTDIFTRTVTVSTVDAVTKQVVSTVTWPQTLQRTGTVTLTEYLGNTALLRLQSNSLVVNTSGATVGGTGNRDITGITFQNSGASSITIDRITLTWTNALSSLTQVQINSTTVWTGTMLTGGTADITNTAIAAGATVPFRIRFSLGMTSNVFTMTITMTDGSTKLVTFSP